MTVAMFIIAIALVSFGYEIMRILEQQKNDIDMAFETIIIQLQGIDAKLTEAQDEILGKIADLEEALSESGEVPAEVQVLLDQISEKAAQLADIVPDVQST